MMMIPYVNVPAINIPILNIPLQPFGVLVVTGILIGTWLARWRATKVGVDRDDLDSFVMWVLGGAFIGAHVLDTIFYYPERLREPWRLLFLWEGISSFGGFIGCVVGGLLWKKFPGKGKPILPMADLTLSVLPVAWIFGRAGCAAVHDHPGALTAHWLGVDYPDGRRWDLGFLEMLFAIVLSAGVSMVWRKKLPVGMYVAIVTIAYAPVRFFMDFLRETDVNGGDVRWGGLTFAQWMCVVMLVFGAGMLAWVLRRGEAVPAPSSSVPELRPRRARRRRK